MSLRLMPSRSKHSPSPSPVPSTRQLRSHGSPSTGPQASEGAMPSMCDANGRQEEALDSTATEEDNWAVDSRCCEASGDVESFTPPPPRLRPWTDRNANHYHNRHCHSDCHWTPIVLEWAQHNSQHALSDDRGAGGESTGCKVGAPLISTQATAGRIRNKKTIMKKNKQNEENMTGIPAESDGGTNDKKMPQQKQKSNTRWQQTDGNLGKFVGINTRAPLTQNKRKREKDKNRKLSKPKIPGR